MKNVLMMNFLGLFEKILIGFVAFQHIAFLVLESFLWTSPMGLKVFRMSPAQAEATKVMAQNQGLYNGFLAAGLIWALLAGDFRLKIFFLTCVVIAGVVGAMTASWRIILVQALPAFIALLITFFNRN